MEAEHDQRLPDAIEAHLIPVFGHVRLGELRPRDISAWVSDVMEKPHGRFKRPLSGKFVNLLLNVACSVYVSAIADELVDANRSSSVKRPKTIRRRWRILEPNEVARVLAAFTDERAGRVFLTLTLTGLRRFELQALRWRDLSFTDRTLRVVESKSEEGERLIALAPALVAALEAHYAASAFKADANYVFAHPQRGTRLESEWYAGEFRAALAEAGDHGLREAVPRRTPRRAHEPRRGRGVTPGDHGDRGAPVARDDQAVRQPGRRRVPRRGRVARASHVRGTGNRYQGAANGFA